MSNVAVEPLASLLDKHGCAALLSVYAPYCTELPVPIANPSNYRVEISAAIPVAAIAAVAIAANSPSTAATNPQLSRNEKLRKVLRELQFDALSRQDSVSIDDEVPAKLARTVPTYACPVEKVDRFDARTDWIA